MKNLLRFLSALPLIGLSFFSQHAAAQLCTGEVQIIPLGSAGNFFSTLNNGVNCISFDSLTNSLIFIHRNDPSIFGGTTSTLRYDYSTDGGKTWTLNVGTLAPDATAGANGARYPQVVNYNPKNSSLFSKNYLVFHSPTTSTLYWDGYVTGVRKLDGSTPTEHFNQAGVTNTFVPGGMCEGKPGIFWTADAILRDTINFIASGVRVLNGTFSNNDVTWVVNAELSPPLKVDGGFTFVAGYNIAFDPSGKYGWICFQSQLASDNGYFGARPIFYKSTDAGKSWSGPIDVALTAFANVMNNISAGNFPECTGNLDMTVDYLGHPHAFMDVASGPGNDYSYFTHDAYLYDITFDGAQWKADEVSLSGSAFGYLSSDLTLTHDNDPQVTRSKDGKVIGFFWTETDSTIILENDYPNLYGRFLKAGTDSFSVSKEYTSCTPYGNNILIPRVAPTMISKGNGEYNVPAIFAQQSVPGDENQPTTYLYLDNVNLHPCDFAPVPVDATIISSNGVFNLCPGTTLTLSTTNESSLSYQWSFNGTAIDGATQSSLVVSEPGTYSVVVSNVQGCTASNSAEVTETCAKPTNLSVSSITQVSASISFTAAPNCTTGWDVRYMPEGGDWIYMNTNSIPTKLTHLKPNTQYTVEAQTFCDIAHTDSSGFSDSVVFSTYPCDPPSNLQSSRITATSAQLTWFPVPSGKYYKLVLQEVVTGDSIVKTIKPVYISGTTVKHLTPNTEYKWVMQTQCTNRFASHWSQWQYFTTLSSERMELNVPEAVLEIYPNPTSGSFILSFISSTENPVQIFITDLTGKVLVQENSGSLSGEFSKQIDCSKFPSGIYFVKVKTGDQVFVKKLEVVK